MCEIFAAEPCPAERKCAAHLHQDPVHDYNSKECQHPMDQVQLHWLISIAAYHALQLKVLQSYAPAQRLQGLLMQHARCKL